MVLLVRKPAPPAALARLIVPGTLVVQTTDGDDLALLEDFDGPAIVAVVPEGAAVFRFDPSVASGTGLTVDVLPEDEPRAVGALSVARQEAELELLKLLDGASADRVVAAAGEPAEAAEPTDKLAAWLLRQATIPSPEEA